MWARLKAFTKTWSMAIYFSILRISCPLIFPNYFKKHWFCPCLFRLLCLEPHLSEEMSWEKLSPCLTFSSAVPWMRAPDTVRPPSVTLWLSLMRAAAKFRSKSHAVLAIRCLQSVCKLQRIEWRQNSQGCFTSCSSKEFHFDSSKDWNGKPFHT